MNINGTIGKLFHSVGSRTATPSILVLACYILYEILQAQNKIIDLMALHNEKLNIILDRLRGS